MRSVSKQDRLQPRLPFRGQVTKPTTVKWSIVKMLATCMPCELQRGLGFSQPSSCLDMANNINTEKVLYCLIVAVVH